jgi:flagellar hook-associated protein 2
MYSQLDTDSLVKKMVSGQQTKIDKVYQTKTTNQWKEDAWNDIKDAVNDFADAYTSVLGSSSMLKNSTYESYSVSTSDTTGAVKLTAGSDAVASNVKVTVSQLAVNASATSSATVSASGKTEISSSNTTALSGLSLAKPLQFNSKGNLSFSINGKTFSFSKDTTLQNMINTVNADEDAGVTMKYSRLTDKFSVTADSGGASSKVVIKNIDGNAFGTGSAFGIDDGTYNTGVQDAKVTIDDGSGATTITRDSNNFTIDGMTYDLRDTTASPISFSVNRDYSATTDAVKKFVDATNTLLTKINTYTSAKSYSEDYPPLTEAQKEDMTEEQIKNWETKAKSGVLRHDSTLEKLVSDLKSAFFTSAGGTGDNATSIGLSTASFYSSNAGQLTLDEDALKSALASDPTKVLNIFTGGSSSAASDQQGVVYKLRSTISSFKKSSTTAISTLTTKIDNATTSISDLEDKLSDLSERYYKKFSEMETALSKLNSTSGMLSSLFGSGS